MYHKWKSYDVWFLRYGVCDRQNFLSFWTVFSPFSPLTTQKIKNFEKITKAWINYHFTHVYHKWQLYDVWLLRYWAQQTEYFVILDHFCPFIPLTIQKIKILKKWKKTLQDIIILHKCTVNGNDMMYGSSGMERDGQNVLSFWTVFCTLTPLNNPKNQNFEKW